MPGGGCGDIEAVRWLPRRGDDARLLAALLTTERGPSGVLELLAGADEANGR